ncbi:MAG: hypothetical protein U0031_05610 [Thermomicrobiales bacterium]
MNAAISARRVGREDRHCPLWHAFRVSCCRTARHQPRPPLFEFGVRVDLTPRIAFVEDGEGAFLRDADPEHRGPPRLIQPSPGNQDAHGDDEHLKRETRKANAMMNRFSASGSPIRSVSCCFASKMGQLAGNHFLTVIEGNQHLATIGKQCLWEGAQDIVFARA